MGCIVSGVCMQNWLNSKIKLTTDNVHLLNYYTSLTIQVEELELTDRLCILHVGTTQNPGPDHVQAEVKLTGEIMVNLRVRFTPPPQHTYKDRTT